MELIKKVDEEATIANVREFFSENGGYDKILQRSGALNPKNPRSPKGDITGVPGSSAGNAQENKYVEYVQNKLAYDAISYAIGCCRQLSQDILNYRYLEHRKVWQVKRLIGYTGNSVYPDKDRQACLDFADTIEIARVLYHVDEDTIPKLQKEKQEQNGSKMG